MIKGKIAFYLLATAIVLTIHSCKNNSIANTKFVTVETGVLCEMANRIAISAQIYGMHQY